MSTTTTTRVYFPSGEEVDEGKNQKRDEQKIDEIAEKCRRENMIEDHENDESEALV